MIFTVIGTLTHELGHYGVAESLGYDARINYRSTYWMNDHTADSPGNLSRRYHKEIINGFNFPGRKQYFAATKKPAEDDWKISLGGPLQTMLTGSMGLVLMLSFRNKFFTSTELPPGLWLLIFLTLFWLRQLFNFGTGLTMYILQGRIVWGDEVSLAKHTGLPALSILTATGLAAAFISAFVIFRFIPLPQRFTFIIAGLAGGGLGFYLWMFVAGPVLMP